MCAMKLSAAAQKNEKIDLKTKTQFTELTRKTYAEQAKWYLNAFWPHGADKDAEAVWKYAHKFMEYDDKKKKAGNELDQLMSHHFLQSFGQTLTAMELKNKLRAIDVDANGKMALLEYLLFTYERTVKDCIDNPQGGSENQKEIDDAAEKLNSMLKAADELQVQLEIQRKNVEKQKQAEAEARKAEEANRVAVEELKQQQAAIDAQVRSLETQISESKSVVAKGRASQELASLKGADPTPLRRARLTQEASLKRLEKERAVLEAATKVVQEQQHKLEQEQKALSQKIDEAQAALEELKKRGGVAHGSIWYMEREVQEAKLFLPQSRGGVARR